MHFYPAYKHEDVLTMPYYRFEEYLVQADVIEADELYQQLNIYENHLFLNSSETKNKYILLYRKLKNRVKKSVRVNPKSIKLDKSGFDAAMKLLGGE